MASTPTRGAPWFVAVRVGGGLAHWPTCLAQPATGRQVRNAERSPHHISGSDHRGRRRSRDPAARLGRACRPQRLCTKSRSSRGRPSAASPTGVIPQQSRPAVPNVRSSRGIRPWSAPRLPAEGRQSRQGRRCYPAPTAWHALVSLLGVPIWRMHHVKPSRRAPAEESSTPVPICPTWRCRRARHQNSTQPGTSRRRR